MQIKFKNYFFDLSEPLDISIAIKNGNNNPKAFYSPDTTMQAVQTEDFVGSTTAGGILNFKNIFLNPHGSGTHTECLGHITTNNFTINECLKKFHHLTQVVTIAPEVLENGDNLITRKQFESIEFNKDIKAIAIRTLPNAESKTTKNWSGTNPCYIHFEAMEYLVNLEIEHFLIDCPSVDREDDNGMLLAHKSFWGLLDESTKKRAAVSVNPTEPLKRKHCSITEMIYIPPSIQDGLFLMNIQIISLEMDASPSKIVLYATK